jgi:hypothetical protein
MMQIMWKGPLDCGPRVEVSITYAMLWYCDYPEMKECH